MLQEVIRLQNRAVTSLVEEIGGKREVTFKAPTGSGKTHMMADFMDRVLEANKQANGDRVNYGVIFLVSSLSKSGLARQNYEKFREYKSTGEFRNINPHLISSEISGEESLYIPTDCNVYILPRDLYKKGGRLMQGAMDNFLKTMTTNLFGDGQNKTVYLIKDECHQATNNLDSLSETYFSKTINISATPKLSRRQVPDVEITEEEAINAKLIKSVEWDESYDSKVGDAIEKFMQIKEEYSQKIGVNPCLIIQISNKEQADEDMKEIMKAISKHTRLKWMLIVNEQKNCDTNDYLKARHVPVSRWKDYAKSNESTIDIIIFKLVITEGWDIPRACMLYQMRHTQSEQLDEQVVGRVRRNPRLMDFEMLSEENQQLALKAWVWGMQKKPARQILTATLFEEPSDITEKIRIKTTRLKTLTEKQEFSINDYMSHCKSHNRYASVFELYRKFKKTGPEVQQLGLEYAKRPCQWMKFCENIDEIARKNAEYVCDYAQSMVLSVDETDKVREVSFAVNTIFTDNGNRHTIRDWVWTDGRQNDFSFDSDAERRWAAELDDIAKDETDEAKPRRVARRVTVGKNNPMAGQLRTDGSVEPDKINPKKKYLWGKNFVSNSQIKYEYYMQGIHSSFPDFALEDCFGRIHLFEVKSINVANATPAGFDSDAYMRKIEELEKCYQQASLLTGHIFYVSVLRNDSWHITKLEKGDERTLTIDELRQFIRTNPVSEQIRMCTSINKN